MLRRILFLILLLALAIPIAAAPNKSGSNAAVPSTFLFNVPAEWKQIEPEYPFCLAVMIGKIYPVLPTMMNVIYSEVGNMSLKDYFMLGEQTSPKIMSNYKRLDYGDATIDGVPGYYVVCTFTVGDKKTLVKSKLFVAIRKGFAYTFTFACPEKYFNEHSKEFEDIMKSTKWLDPPKTSRKS